MKVGFSLMPIALEGLGRISHLINIDTVEDLVILMKTVLTCTYTLRSFLHFHVNIFRSNIILYVIKCTM
jgi:hypothetical protein